jgi:hypothetical protein
LPPTCALADLAFAAGSWESNGAVPHCNTAARPRSLAERPVPLPTLFRFLATIAILAGLVFAGMFALATFVQPTQREMSVTIPNTKLQPGNR